MKAPDINVLVGAFRLEHPHHALARAWLERTLASGEPIGLSPYVATGVVRVLTDRKIWPAADSIDEALTHLDTFRLNASVSPIVPGPRHWEIFAELCRAAGARGPLVADAAHAAVAIEHGATWVTFDRDFARFPGLRWQVPGE